MASARRKASIVLYHLSFNVRDPRHVAGVLSEILGAVVLDAPSPPFVRGALFVCCGDERGTMISLEPWSTEYGPGPACYAAMTEGHATPEHNAFHGLFLAKLPEPKILEIAAREGWPAGRVSNGPFEVINVWIEGRQLIEFTTPELYGAYQATFGPEGLKTLDGSLRLLERELAAMFAAQRGA